MSSTRSPAAGSTIIHVPIVCNRLLAHGKTTRETAVGVFLNPKTIEYHLRNVYRKVGIHSREELAAALA